MSSFKISIFYMYYNFSILLLYGCYLLMIMYFGNRVVQWSVLKSKLEFISILHQNLLMSLNSHNLDVLTVLFINGGSMMSVNTVM